MPDAIADIIRALTIEPFDKSAVTKDTLIYAQNACINVRKADLKHLFLKKFFMLSPFRFYCMKKI